jgi:hypothetical protein
MRTTSRILATLAVAGLASSLSSCTPAPGQYRIYKVTSLPANPQADCGVEIDIRDSTTFFGAATIAIFATDADDFFLEYGDKVVTGSRDGKDYTFEGVSVQVDDPIDGTTITTTSQLVVKLTIDGRKINGEATSFDSVVCGGTCDAFENTQCTVVGNFFGTEIKDVELEHPI